MNGMEDPPEPEGVVEGGLGLKAPQTTPLWAVKQQTSTISHEHLTSGPTTSSQACLKGL